ncbi:hypothetical protein [Saccharothrix syringae]|uniref:hypothetical protein n=1 Tax=Saccharothrix syringae TaxID=103733 RepID=UPI000A940F6F|nr:hypothetical protein [Saccharothrix syringae]
MQKPQRLALAAALAAALGMTAVVTAQARSAAADGGHQVVAPHQLTTVPPSPSDPKPGS